METTTSRTFEKWLPSLAGGVFNAIVIYQVVLAEYFEHKGVLWNHMAPQTMLLLVLAVIAPMVAYAPRPEGNLVPAVLVTRLLGTLGLLLVVLTGAATVQALILSLVCTLEMAPLLIAFVIRKFGSKFGLQEDDSWLWSAIGKGLCWLSLVFLVGPVVIGFFDSAIPASPEQMYQNRSEAIIYEAVTALRLTYDGKTRQVRTFDQVADGSTVFELEGDKGKPLFVELMAYEGSAVPRFKALQPEDAKALLAAKKQQQAAAAPGAR